MNRALLTLSLSGLAQMIQKRKKELRRLTRERRRAEQALRKIDQEIARIGGNGRALPHLGRARNAASLASTIESAIRSGGKPLSISDIIAAVTGMGYRSGSSNFRSVVNLTLIKDPRFKKVERGVYGLKGNAPAAVEAEPKQAPKRRRRKRKSSPQGEGQPAA